MSSFHVDLSAKDRASGRFMLRSLRNLARAAYGQMRRRRLSQSKVAQELGIDKAVVSRILKGGANPTLRTVGEMAWAFGLRPELTFHPLEHDGRNREPARMSVEIPAAGSTGSSAVVGVAIRQSNATAGSPVTKSQFRTERVLS